MKSRETSEYTFPRVASRQVGTCCEFVRRRLASLAMVPVLATVLASQPLPRIAVAEDAFEHSGNDAVYHESPTVAHLQGGLAGVNSASVVVPRGQEGGRIVSAKGIPVVGISAASDGSLTLSDRPDLRGQLGERFVGRTTGKNYVFFSIDKELQDFVSRVVSQAQANHVAIVAMNPKTGAVLAMASKSATIDDLEYHAGFPAASLFKVVTASAAVEQAGIRPESLVAFRGGTYTLNEANYLPNERLDRRVMSVAEALGRSCNPVFGQIGIRYLNGNILAKYAKLFGFNRSLGFEASLPISAAVIPQDDLYELSRTSAGFGEVRISPIHAAALMSGIANGGLLPRPKVVEKIVSPDGSVLLKSKPEYLQRIVRTTTAATVMEMMQYTTTVGTSRKEFMRGTRPTLGDIEVAAKTGTLKGDNPVGLNNWFIAAAPMSNPELAVAVITVDPRYSSKASHLGRRVFERYFNITPSEPERRFVRVSAPVSTPHRKGRAPSHLVKKGSRGSQVVAKKTKSSKATSKKGKASKKR